MQETPPAPADPNAPALHRRWEITVQAGSVAREAQMLNLQLPAKPPVKSALVREAKGALVPSQIEGDGQLAFRIKAMKEGSQATYLVEEEEVKPSKGGVLAVQDRNGVKLTVDGKPIVVYQTQRQARGIALEYLRNGYLHPLYSPAGVVVTDDYPKGKPYQHGIWSGWQKVAFGESHPDFWDMGRKKGRVTMESAGPLWGGPLLGGFIAHQYFTDLDSRRGTTALSEGWRVTAFREAGKTPYFVVDLEARQEALNDQVILGENPFGGITLRGNSNWQGSGNSMFLTSEGQARVAAQGATAHWCYLGGKSGGKQAGVAVLSHPKNAKLPEAVFIDPEDPVMGFSPVKNGPITVQSGQPLKLRYRFVVLDGKPDSKLFDRLWNDFADPPTSSLRQLGGK
jgi:hypothetical protein